MRVELFISTLLCLLPMLAGCDKNTSAPLSATKQPSVDVCALLTKEEIQAIEGSPLKRTQSSEHVDQGIRSSHCFYATEDPGKSISLLLTEKDPNFVKGQQDPKEVWTGLFNRESDEKKEEEIESKGNQPGNDEEEERLPPTKIAGLGDGAYWINSRKASALYVLKKDRFIRISLSSAEKDDIEKSKTLAQKAIERL